MSEVLTGHVLDRLAEMPAESVSCVCTSPPYWSLRRYEAEDVVWGGAAACDHDFVPERHNPQPHGDDGTAAGLEGGTATQASTRMGSVDSSTCARCGAWRGQYGLEPTPELYVEHSLDVLRGIRRVLRPDGVVWWNIGDGYYASSTSDRQRHWDGRPKNLETQPQRVMLGKPKDLVLMPFRIALAAQADGWWVRSVIVWAKPNAMPESTQDRPTTSHEYILMLVKNGVKPLSWYNKRTGEVSDIHPRKRGRWDDDVDFYWAEKGEVIGHTEDGEEIVAKKRRRVTFWRGVPYWYDADAVREAQSPNTHSRGLEANTEDYWERRGGDHAGWKSPQQWLVNGRNLRSVWTFPTAAVKEAHFATFPPELPRRAIEASCPREVCVRCGHARVRLVESTTHYEGGSGKAGNNPTDGKWGTTRGAKILMGPVVETTTTGWTSCDCVEPDYQPGLVLDPFAGVGTTLYVARQLGRRAVGIELSEKYAAIARTKLATWWAPGKITEPAVPEGQAALW